IKILKVLFYGQLLLEANDDLSDTPFYKHKLKNVVNKCNDHVEREIKIQLNNVFEASNETCINLFNQIDEFIDLSSKLAIEEMPVVNRVLTNYLADPEYYTEKTNIEFTKVN
ncbi:MAG: hypothetical protein ACWA5P_01815, partial [bacterium]